MNTHDQLKAQARQLEKMARDIRRAEIVNLHKSGWSFAKIGRKYKLTRERIRQIVNEDEKPN